MGQAIKTDKSFRQEIGSRLKNTSPLKMFNVLRDLSDDEKFVNIFRSYIVNESVFDDERYYYEYEVGNDEWWDTISYKAYETDSLWWLIAMTNNIVNPFEELEEGMSLKILSPEYIYKILKEVENIGKL